MKHSIQFYNTLDRKKHLFEPLHNDQVSLYTCGPTVYSYVHLGNHRTFIFEDILKRVLLRHGYQVNHVMNITDVGHLESDTDEGEDKLNKAAQKEKKDVWQIARYYEDSFLEDTKALNMISPNTLCRATDHVNEMIQMIQTLEKRGFTYQVDGNVYFDISRYPDYAKLGQLDLDELKSGVRVDLDQRKKHSADFVLWFSQSKFPNQIMKWDSPWGRGFPGWHIECSAMSSKYLGEQIDIHCGAIDLIPVHHTNEIAQSECAFGHKWVNFWLHGEFLIINKEKMSKSTGELFTLKEFCQRGFSPLHYRYFCLQAHYRSQLNFNWDAADAAKRAYENLTQRILSYQGSPGKVDQSAYDQYIRQFNNLIYDDLNIPVALSLAWEVAKNNSLKDPTKLAILLSFDEVFGLDLNNAQMPPLTDNQKNKLEQRKKARQEKNWSLSDQIRDELAQEGLILKDTAEGTIWHLSYID